MTEITAIAPARIDLAGGTLDIWPLNLFFDSPVTLNMAISITVRATVKIRRDKKIVLISEDQGEKVIFASCNNINHNHKLGMLSRVAKHFVNDKTGVTVTTCSDAPTGAGLGGSSALVIALIAAFAKTFGKNLSKPDMIDIAKDIEAALLKIPTGLQDYAAAVYGRVNSLSFPPGGMKRERIKRMDKWLSDRILLFYSGQSRFSGVNNWEILKKVVDGDKRMTKGLGAIADCANRASMALKQEDEKAFITAVNNEFNARLKLFPAISTKKIDNAISAGRKAGADGARICGAGGGGCFFLIVKPALRSSVIDAVEKQGIRQLPYIVSRRGVFVAST